MIDQRQAPTNTKTMMIGLTVVCVVVLQFAIPAFRLTADRPARFGWHMYSGNRESPTFWALSDDGNTSLIDLDDYVAYQRAELDYLPGFPAFLCRQRRDLAAVRYQISDSATIEEIQCR